MELQGSCVASVAARRFGVFLPHCVFPHWGDRCPLPGSVLSASADPVETPHVRPRTKQQFFQAAFQAAPGSSEGGPDGTSFQQHAQRRGLNSYSVRLASLCRPRDPHSTSCGSTFRWTGSIWINGAVVTANPVLERSHVLRFLRDPVEPRWIGNSPSASAPGPRHGLVNAAPVGTRPVVAYRHSATSSLRATAMMARLRMSLSRRRAQY